VTRAIEDADRRRAQGWAGSFDSVFSALRRSVGFTLLPVIVPGATVARALAAAIEARGVAVALLAPTDEAEWASVADSLLTPRSLANDAVTVLVVEGSPRAVQRGLWKINQQREAIARVHDRPLVWCVDREALRMTGETAPDFWSVRAVPREIVPASATAPATSVGRPLAALIALIADGSCVDPAIWDECSAALDGEGARSDAAYAAESAAYFSGASELGPRLGRAATLRSQLAGGSLTTATLAVSELDGPEMRSMIALLARETQAGRFSGESASADDLATIEQDARSTHRARAVALSQFGVWPSRAGPAAAIGAPEILDALGSSAGAQRALVQTIFERAQRALSSRAAVGVHERSVPRLSEAVAAVGFARLGCRAEVAAIHDELRATASPESDDETRAGSPNRLLLELYRQRAQHDLAERSKRAWAHLFERTIRVESSSERVSNRAMILAKRSEWLRNTPPPDLEPHWTHHEAERSLETVLSASKFDSSALRTWMQRNLFDHERARAIELTAARATQHRDIDEARVALDAAIERCDDIAILGHRAAALGACARAALAMGDNERLSRVSASIVRMVRSTDQTLSTRDLLLAATPAVRGARQLDALDVVAALLRSLRKLAGAASRDSLRLRALIAEGSFAQGNHDVARSELEGIIRIAYSGSLDFNGAYDVTMSAVDALTLFPIAARAAGLTALADGVATFGDNFTTRRFFPTYALLTLEALLRAAIAPTPEQRKFVETSVRTSRSFARGRSQ
jgi:hypothetical protein